MYRSQNLVRGAYNKLIHLSEIPRKKGVVAASADNHAQGLAYAASRLDIPSIIVMPERTPLPKVNATRGYGAEVFLYGKDFNNAMIKATELVEEKGFTLIPAFDDEQIITGQGTIGLEIF